MLGPDSICLNKTGHEAFLNEKLFLDNKSNVEYRNNHYLQIRKPGIVYYCLWQLWVRLISIQQCSLPRLHSQTWCLSSYLEIVSFFVCLFVFIFFSFSALSGCLYFLFLYKFCCQLLSKQIFLVSVFFLCAVFDCWRLFILSDFTDFHWSLTGFVFCLFFSFVVFNGPKFPVYYCAFFLLVRLLLPPAPTSLTLDPRVFSFSSIVAAEKRDHPGDDVAKHFHSHSCPESIMGKIYM